MIFRSRIRSMVLRLAEWLARRYGYTIVENEAFERAGAGVNYLGEYAQHSGHLRRGFKAGKVVERTVRFIGEMLTHAGARTLW